MKILAAKIGNETKNLYRSVDENDEEQIPYGHDSFFSSERYTYILRRQTKDLYIC